MNTKEKKETGYFKKNVWILAILIICGLVAFLITRNNPISLFFNILLTLSVGIYNEIKKTHTS